MTIPQPGQNQWANLFAAWSGRGDRHFPQLSNFGLKFAPDLIHRAVLEDDWGRSLFWGVTMGTASGHDQRERRVDSQRRCDQYIEENPVREDGPSAGDDDQADDMLSLLEENARLRGLVVKLSSLILRNVAEQR